MTMTSKNTVIEETREWLGMGAPQRAAVLVSLAKTHTDYMASTGHWLHMKLCKYCPLADGGVFRDKAGLVRDLLVLQYGAPAVAKYYLAMGPQEVLWKDSAGQGQSRVVDSGQALHNFMCSMNEARLVWHARTMP